MVSKKSHVTFNTRVERKSGYVFITRVKNGTAQETLEAVCKRLSLVPPDLRKTLTLDNGSENSCSHTIATNLDLDCYHAHPYSSWERGTNENTNGLIRWYLPKGTDFGTITDEQLVFIEHTLNTRPRKRLGYKNTIRSIRCCTNRLNVPSYLLTIL